MPAIKAPRNVCFTLNNFTRLERQRLTELTDHVRYIVFGTEVGDSGTPHIQGYAEFLNQHTVSAMKRMLGERTHFEMRRGTPKQAAGYCKKGEDVALDYEHFFETRTVEQPATWTDPYEYGTISHPGKRTDITAPVEMLTEGASVATVARAFPEQWIKYHKGFRDLRSLLLPPRNLIEMPNVIVLWGETGTGKTRDAYTKFWPDEPYYVWKPSNGNWWDGYDGQKKVIIDEFRGQMTWSDILGLLDRNEFRAPFKGGFVNIQADKFVITSPFPPHKWYKDDDRYDRFKQLERRIKSVYHYNTPLDSLLVSPYMYC